MEIIKKILNENEKGRLDHLPTFVEKHNYIYKYFLNFDRAYILTIQILRAQYLKFEILSW